MVARTAGAELPVHVSLVTPVDSWSVGAKLSRRLKFAVQGLRFAEPAMLTSAITADCIGAAFLLSNGNVLLPGREERPN